METGKRILVAVAFAILISGCLGGDEQKNAAATANITKNSTETPAATAKTIEEAEIVNVTEYSEILKSKIPIECQATVIQGSGDDYSNYVSIAIRAKGGKMGYKTMASAYGGRGGYSESEGIYLANENVYYVKARGVDLQGKQCEWQKFPALNAGSSGVSEEIGNANITYACRKGNFDDEIFKPEGSVCNWEKTVKEQNAKGACAQIADENLRKECEKALG